MTENTKSFEQQLKDRDIFDIKEAARRSGYSEQHLRRLCHEEKIEHRRRRGGSQYFFTPAQIAGLFKDVVPDAK